MQSPLNFIVTPKKKRYKTTNIAGVELHTSTSIENAKDVSKEAIVIAIPKIYDGEILPGDEVLIHHNVFRDYYNQYGKLKHAKSYLYDDLFTVIPEELFLYKKNGEWKPNLDFCFVEPILEDTISFLSEGNLKHTGNIYLSNTHKTKNPIGFTPESEYEIEIEGKVYYRMKDCDIMIYNRFSV
jgi:hypothetical protein